MEEFDIRNIQQRHSQMRASGGDGDMGGGRQMNMPRCNKKICCGCSCCTIILLIILFFTGLASLSPLEYGLRYNRFTKVTDDKHVQYRGRHFIWPWCSFLRFPATAKNLELSDRSIATATAITGRTKEGLALTLHVAFQYKLYQQSVAKLYKKVGFKYEAYFMKLARENILVCSSKYTGPEFWLKRDSLGDEMYELVKQALEANYAECTGLQILRIDLPDNYENAIITTQVTRQQSYTQKNAQQATWVRANISVLNATYQNNITVTLANATAYSTQLVKEAEAKANQMKLQAEKEALENSQGNLSLSDEGMVEYQKLFAFTQVPNAKFLFGVGNAVVLDPEDTKSASELTSEEPASCAG